ncbi:MAG TPA: PAP/fibrillin family protein [Waterburya sp.]|jgi:hypothetical protein
MVSKAELLEAIAGKNRGLLATEMDKTAILAAVARLEDRNPTPRPVEATELLEGNWRLLYTTSNDLLNLGRLPSVPLGQIYQCVRTATTSIYNIAEVSELPLLEGLVSVVARFNPVNERRVNVKFERSIIGLRRLIDYQSPNNFIQQLEAGKKFFPALDFGIDNRQQKAWLDITYLDSDLRIGRGNAGSVFVLTKVS